MMGGPTFKNSCSGLLDTEEQLKQRLRGILKRNSTDGADIKETDDEDTSEPSEQTRGSVESENDSPMTLK